MKFQDIGSGIIIPGVEIPKNCHECDSCGISDIVGLKCPCDANKELYSYDKRPEECPLAVHLSDPLLRDALALLKELEPHVIGLGEIEDGEGYWLTTMSSDFIPRPVIVVHNEKDAGKPYITLAWQYGTSSWEAETYGIAWRLWSAKPIGREW